LLDALSTTDASLAVAAPTGSGKTVLFDLAIIRLFTTRSGARALYVAPLRALVQERVADWRARLTPLGIKVAELSGDSEAGWADGDLVCTTPEKLDAVTRRGGRPALAAFALVCLDEVHSVGDPTRGPALEAVISRLKLCAPPGLRFIAASATVPNVAEVGAWLGAPPGNARAFGEEFRACALEVVVQGYSAFKSEFLFERSLKNFLYPLLLRHGAGRPALVFCASRKEAEEAAALLVASIPPRAGYLDGPPHPFVRTAAAAAALASAAGALSNARLAALVPAGVAFHSAALSGADRLLVERLFREAALTVLCSTSTLALGVNLPAALVVVKGVRQYEKGGYIDYPTGTVLQMIGRAGRPQFDARGTAVIMCERTQVPKFSSLAAGGEPVQSRLEGALAEHLAAEVCAGTVRDVATALAWLKASFLWARMAASPSSFSLPPGAGPREAAGKALLLRTCGALAEADCVAQDADGLGLSPTPAGVAMTANYVRFATMAAAQLAPRPVGCGDVLLLLASAAEFSFVALRRDEKTVCKALAAAAPFPLPDAAGKPLKVFTTGAQKLFLLAQDALADTPSEAVTRCFALRSEQEDMLRTGARLARAIAQAYLAARRLSGSAHALALARALDLHCWDAAPGSLPRQFPGVGPAFAAKLAAAGLSSPDALASAGSRTIEAVVGRAPPFGANLVLAAARTPRLRLVLDATADGAMRPGATLTFTLRLSADPTPEAAAALSGARDASSMAATLVAGSRQDDTVLLTRRLSVSPAQWALQLHFSATVPTSGPLQVVAGVIFDGCAGRDATTLWKWLPPPAPGQPPLQAAAKRVTPAAAEARPPKRPNAASMAFEAVAAKGATLPTLAQLGAAQTAKAAVDSGLPRVPMPPSPAAAEAPQPASSGANSIFGDLFG